MGPTEQILDLASSALAQYSGAIAQIAAATGSEYVDNFDPFTGKGPALTHIADNPDPSQANIHPTGTGYSLIASDMMWTFSGEQVTLSHSTKHVKHASVRRGYGKATKSRSNISNNFVVHTGPYSNVSINLSYIRDGWSESVTKTGVADATGTFKASWIQPKLAKKIQARYTVDSVYAASGMKHHELIENVILIK